MAGKELAKRYFAGIYTLKIYFSGIRFTKAGDNREAKNTNLKSSC